MKQITNKQLTELNKNIIYLFYSNHPINQKISDTLECDLSKIINHEELKVTTIHTLGRFSFDTITFISLGLSSEITTKKLRTMTTLIKNRDAILYLDDLDTNNLDIHTITRTIAENYLISSYQEQKIGHEIIEIANIDFAYSQASIEDDIEIGKAYGEGINYARKLSDTPANIMTPIQLVDEAKKLSQTYDLELTVLNKDDLIKMEAGGILAVNQGSEIPAYVICLKYNNSTAPYTAVIGKGLTFDSGGYNIKSNSYGMKYDMCGGADVLGVMKILATTKAKANVYGIIPTTENLVSEKAYKPQDVITTLAKKTVEIVSTDAEGRLILADAITYSQQLGIKQIIDLATLTGACVAALGDIYTGVFSNNDEYYREFVQAMAQSDEKGWRLPIDQEYFDKLKSNSADFKNSAGKPGAGASLAANFLAAFIEDGIKWLHLDIAGTADNNGQGATGAMVRSVVKMVSE